MQEPSLHTPAELQARPPQHWFEEVQWEPWVRQPPSVQMPLEQVRVPQQSEELEQCAPRPKQVPSAQILLELQVSVPQQSPEVLQCPPLPVQGTMILGSPGGMSGSPGPQAAEASAAKRTRTRGLGFMFSKYKPGKARIARALRKRLK